MPKYAHHFAKASNGTIRKMWVEQEDGTFFELKSRNEVAVDRFNNFVTELPPNARIVPRPPMVNHTQEDLDKLAVMRRDHEALLEKGSPAYTQTMSILDHPALSFKQKGKKLWALRKQWKHAMVSKDRGRSVVEGDTGEHTRITYNSEPKAAKAETPREDPGAQERVRAAMAEVSQWSRATSEFVLQANECSRFHSLVDLMMNGFALGIKSDSGASRQIKDGGVRVWEHAQVFVVKHDWRAAFKDELGKVSDSEFVLPFPTTAFEFKVNNRPCTMMVVDPMSGVLEAAREMQMEVVGDTEGLDPGRKFYLFVWASNGSWVPLTEHIGGALFQYIVEQVKAICVMLDAKIAEHTTVKQPAALNTKRVKSGRVPLFDYRVVDLAKKYHVHDGPKNTTGVRQRCHLRRGHWVHAEQRPRVDIHRPDQRWQQHDGKWRTWVNWYLAGDPDLGFVEKEYKL